MLLLVAFLLARGIRGTPTPPIWGPQFTVNIWQTITEMDYYVYDNTVRMYYDAPANMSLEIHGDGQHDEYCTSLPEGANGQPCSHLVYKDGWRYLIFPESELCCRCCSFEQYCSIISPTWLNNASYLGKKVINGTEAEGWLKWGQEANQYWTTADGTLRPVQYNEYYESTLVYTNYWNYDTGPMRFDLSNCGAGRLSCWPGDSYVASVDPTVFALPSYCTQQRCNSTTCLEVPRKFSIS